MQEAIFKGKKWLVDLEWEILPGDEQPMDEAKEIANRSGMTYGVMVDYDGQHALGLYPKSGKIQSASLFLAFANQAEREAKSELDVYPDWIVIEDMGDEKYWMAVIKNGIPSPQSDKILDITTVRERISELLINDTYKVYSECGEIQALFDGLKVIESKSLNDLTSGVEKKAVVLKLRGLPVFAVYAGLALIGVAIVGFSVMTFMDSYYMKQRQLALQKQQQEAQLRAQNLYMEQLKLYKKTVKKVKDDALQQVALGLSGSPRKMLNAWYEAIGGLEVGTNNWDLKEIDCSFDAKDGKGESSCVLNFSRTGLSSNRMLLQDYPDAEISGDKATVTRSVNADGQIFGMGANMAALNSIPQASNWGFDMISQLQLLKIANVNFSVKSSSDIMLKMPKKPLSPQDLASGMKQAEPVPVSLGIATGDLDVSSNNFDLLRELANNVDFKAVGAKGVTFKFGDDGQISWDADFVYYVKSGSGEITNSDSSHLSNNSLPSSKKNLGRPGMMGQ